MGAAEVVKLCEVITLFKTIVPLETIQGIYIPDQPSHVTSMLTNTTNRHSLAMILPVPEAVKLTNDLYGCRLCEVVGCALLMPPVERINHSHFRYKSFVKSRHFQSERRRIPSSSHKSGSPVVLAYVNIWSDGWDPNRLSKSNRGSAWTATASILFVDILEDYSDPGVPFLVVTQLLAAGPEKVNHRTLWEALWDEKKNLLESKQSNLSPFCAYSKHHAKNVSLHIATGVFLHDQPERRAVSNLISGNSNIHAYFGLSCEFKNIDKMFEGCQDCMTRLRAYTTSGKFQEPFDVRNCKNCLCWSVDRLCEEASYKKRIAEIPSLTEGEHGYQWQFSPHRITFGAIVDAWELAISKYAELGLWSEKDVKGYLYLFAISHPAVDAFIEQCRNYIVATDAKDPDSRSWDDCPESREDVLAEEKADPLSFMKPTVPAIWFLTEIDLMPEVPMHLAMNLQKSVVKTYVKLCTRYNKGTEMCRRFSVLLLKAQGLNVSGLRTIKIKDDKFGGYVAENYKAMASMFPWLSRVFEVDAMQPGAATADPDPSIRPQHQWSMKENRTWLNRRGITIPAKAPPLDVKELVQKNLNDTNCPPVIDNYDAARNLPSSDLRLFMLDSHRMFSAMFATDLVEEPARNRLLALSMIFLTQWTCLDRIAVPRAAKVKAIYLAKYNTCGVLRCPDHFLPHSMFRILHEGGDMGEGLVKTLRALCPSAVREGWALHLINKFYRARAMSVFVDDMKSNEKVESNQKGDSHTAVLSKQYLEKFRKYGLSSKTVAQAFKDCEFISILVYYSDSIGFVFGVVETGEDTWRYRVIDLDEGGAWEDPLGFTYYDVELTNRGTMFAKKNNLSLANLQFDCFAYLIPLHPADDDTTSTRYAVMSEDWQQYHRGAFCVLK